MYRGAAENGVGLLAWEAAVGGVGLLARACRLFIKMGEKEVREAENQVAFEAGAGVSGHASFGQATAVRSKKRKEPTANTIKWKRRRESKCDAEKKANRELDARRKRVKREKMSDTEKTSAREANALRMRVRRKKK